MNRKEAGHRGYLKTKVQLDACRRRQSIRAKKKYKEANKKCPTCGRKIPYEKRRGTFCNHSCAARFTRNRWGTAEKRFNLCANCQKGTRNSKYCSQKCVSEHHWKCRKKEIIKRGRFIGFTGNSTCKTPKKYLIEIRGHRCELCRRKTWQRKPIPLVFDHIDGDASNWKLTNCRLVCGNCDMLLPTYKRKNKRSARDKRYKSL